MFDGERMRRGALAFEQAESGEQQRPGAHGADELAFRIEPQARQEVAVETELTGRGAAGEEHRVGLGSLVDRAVHRNGETRTARVVRAGAEQHDPETRMLDTVQ